jgi:hypothetical protein
MATPPECIARFEREDVFAASPERMARALRQRAPGSWPSSPIGGGGASPHVTLTHLTNFMIAQAGFVPSGGPDAIATLRPVPLFDYVDHATLQAPEPQKIVAGTTLGSVLERMIGLAADNSAWRDALEIWSLIMCPDDRVYAMITYKFADHPALIARFSAGDLTWWLRERDRAQRSIEIPRKALMICGELWADSKAKLAAKDENADPPARGPASSTASTAQRRKESPHSSDATARVCVPATSPGGPHGRQRRRSPVSVASGAA